MLTPNGWVEIGCLKVGDLISGADGRAKKVKGVYSQGKKAVYRVTLIDGSSCRCSLDHLWQVHFSSTKRKDGVYTLKDIIGVVGNSKNINAIVPLCVPGEIKDAELPVEPYLLGLLLGDGTLAERGIRFSSEDAELLESIRVFGYGINPIGGCDYSVIELKNRNTINKLGQFESNPDSLMSKIKDLGLHHKTSHYKFVPEVYKTGSVKQKTELLQGLLDTDGTSDKRGHVSFCSVSKRLADDVKCIVWSLGGKATMARKDRKSGLSYHVEINFSNNEKCFKLKRKLDRVRDKRFNGGGSYFGRRIKSVKRVGNEECVCISVEDSLYVTDDYIVTHNTDAGIAWLTRDTEHPKYRALVIRRNADDLHDWIDRATNLYRQCGPVEVVGKPAIIKFPSGATIRTGHLKDENAYTKYQGHEYCRMVIEELNQIPNEELYLKLISSCRSVVPALRPRVFATTNPGNIGHEWVKKRFVTPSRPMQSFNDPVTGRSRIFIPATVDDNPTLTENDPEYIKFLEGLPENLKRAWRYGDWDIYAGQYFSDFRKDVHVCEPFELPKSWTRIRCLDYGFVAPSACLWLAIDYDNNVYVYRELYQTELTYKELAEGIGELTHEDIDYTVADTDMFAKTRDTGEYGHDIMANNHVPITGANKERIPGWQLIRQRLKDKTIIIFNNCPNLIRTLPALVHDERNIEDVDKKCEDHAPCALRYGLMSIPEAPVKEDNPIPRPTYVGDSDAPWNKSSAKSYKDLYSSR